jgi:fatty-acyl-CoA synthase
MPTFFQTLKEHYTVSPERIAVTLQFPREDDRQLSYKSLLDGANAYARHYAEQGIQRNEVIVLILQHGEDLLYAFWGAILHGAIPSIMPFLTEKLSPERYRADLSSLVSVTKPVAIVTYPEFEENVRDALNEDDSVRTVIISDEIGDASPPDFNLLGGGDDVPDDVVLLQHSSGTTGLQKGVALSHQAVWNQLEAYGESIQLHDEKDVIVSWLPLYHDMGLIASFLLPILRGVHLVLMSPFDWVRAPYKLIQAVSQYKGTLTWLPNFAYVFCARRVRERHLEGVDLSSWRGIINCSEPVRWESHQAFYEAFKHYGLHYEALQTSYAMAENTFGVTQSDLSRPPAVDEIDAEIFAEKRIAQPPADGAVAIKMMSSGTPIPNTEVRVLDPDGNEVPERVIGEISLKSNCMLTGYYNRPGITEKSFNGEWYMTGDYGYFADGELYVSGRKKELIIVGGKNIYPLDIETLVYEVDGVHAGRATAFGIYDEQNGTEEVVVVAESDLDGEADQAQLADAVRKHVTKNSAVALRYVQIVPKMWIIKTSSGKPARTANKEKYLKEFAD